MDYPTGFFPKRAIGEQQLPNAHHNCAFPGLQVDYTKDFFSKPAFLTVSGQLNGARLCTAAPCRSQLLRAAGAAQLSCVACLPPRFHALPPRCAVLGGLPNSTSVRAAPPRPAGEYYACGLSNIYTFGAPLGNHLGWLLSSSMHAAGAVPAALGWEAGAVCLVHVHVHREGGGLRPQLTSSHPPLDSPSLQAPRSERRTATRRATWPSSG